MKVHNLVQGSADWLAYRAEHFNASDAPAMMGCSPYKTRSALVAELATGFGEEITAEKQRVFDAGHRFESLARPLAEKIVGEELYPVTGSNDRLSASFDGLTMAEDIAFEHKSLNDALRAAMVDGCTGADLPMLYQVQMEQQCMVAGCSRVLFMASKWDADDHLIEERHCWYTSNPGLAEQIRAGWAQLEQDVCAYQPPAASAVALVAQPVQALPSVAVKVEGQIAVTSNLQVFEQALRDFIDNRLIRNPETDQDFADLDTQIKAMKGAEAALQSTDQNMLAQIQPVDTALKHSAMLGKLVREHRLMAEKLLASEKDRRRLEIVTRGQQAFRDHIASLNDRLGKPYMPTVPADFAAAVKGMRSIANMEDAVSTLLAQSKVAANAIADKIDANLKHLREHAASHAFLFADAGTIVLKAPEDLQLLVKSRISDHEAAEAKRLADERERIRQEEVARAEREAREDLARRQRAVAAIRFPEPERAAPVASPAQAPAPLSLVSANNAARAAINDAAPVQPAPAAAPGPAAAPAREIVWIKTSDVAEALGLPVNADLLASVGFPATKRQGPGMWWDAEKLPAMQSAMFEHSRKALAVYRARETAAA